MDCETKIEFKKVDAFPAILRSLDMDSDPQPCAQRGAPEAPLQPPSQAWDEGKRDTRRASLHPCTNGFNVARASTICGFLKSS